MTHDQDQFPTAVTLHKQGRTEEAIELLRQEVADDPTNLSARGNLACVLSDSGRYAEAHQILVQLYEDSGDVLTCRNMLVLLGRMGRHEDAMRFGQEAVSKWPDDGWICIELSDACRDGGQDEQAIQAAETVIQNTRDPDLLSAAGIRLGTLRQYAASARALTRAVELKDNNPLFWSDLAASYVGLGEYDCALSAVRRALELRPHDPISLCTLGNCQEHAGRLEDALATYQRAAEIDPPYEGARREVARLQQRLRTKRRHRRLWPFRSRPSGPTD
jgi:Flp pilus assembly protein TadD